MKPPLLVLGAGGHAKVVIDAALRAGRTVVGILDDDPNKQGRSFVGVSVVGSMNDLHAFAAEAAEFVVAVGDNDLRKRLHMRSIEARLSPSSVVHPLACVAESAVIGSGSVLFAGAIVNPDARIGRGVIVNTGASIDHDCVVEDWVHIAPGVAICGAVRIGEGTLVGVGARVLPGVSIGRGCLVAAGAVVCCDLPDYARVAGVPARPMGGMQ